jgi:hypothetical protein
MATERASYCPPSVVEGREPESSDLLTGDPVMTLDDVRRMNKKLAWQRAKFGGLRVKKGYFRCPWPLTRRQYEQYRDRAVEKWIGQMDREGWDIKSKVAVATDRRRLATAYSGDWADVVLPGEVEVPVAAMFQKRKVEHQRIEVLVAG